MNYAQIHNYSLIHLSMMYSIRWSLLYPSDNIIGIMNPSSKDIGGSFMATLCRLHLETS